MRKARRKQVWVAVEHRRTLPLNVKYISTNLFTLAGRILWSVGGIYYLLLHSIAEADCILLISSDWFTCCGMQVSSQALNVGSFEWYHLLGTLHDKEITAIVLG